MRLVIFHCFYWFSILLSAQRRCPFQNFGFSFFVVFVRLWCVTVRLFSTISIFFVLAIILYVWLCSIDPSASTFSNLSSFRSDCHNETFYCSLCVSKTFVLLCLSNQVIVGCRNNRNRCEQNIAKLVAFVWRALIIIAAWPTVALVNRINWSF